VALFPLSRNSLSDIRFVLSFSSAFAFQDEPTSGLDAASSLEVLTALRQLTQTGMTIIVVIHQPRYSIVQQFHRIQLLGKGGSTVFIGTLAQAEMYFKQIGFPCTRAAMHAHIHMHACALNCYGVTRCIPR